MILKRIALRLLEGIFVGAVFSGTVNLLQLAPGQIETFLNFGVGGLVAIVTMIWKRSDDKKYQESLEAILDRREERDERVVLVIEENVRALSEIKGVIEKQASLSELKAMLIELADKDEIS